jgi:putative methionine-R-sulfoxide reductase with GAF domain
LQYELDEGPCLTAWRQREVVRVDDVTKETRWPAWTAAVTAFGIGLQSTLSVPLVVQDESLGAMKVYARDPYAFDAPRGSSHGSKAGGPIVFMGFEAEGSAA